MAYTLTNSINFAEPFVEYIPLTAGFGQEPAVSVASFIRSTILSAPFTWAWNRNEFQFQITAGVQDYIETILDFGFLEKATLIDANGNMFELKDIYNIAPLSISAPQQRPSAISVLIRNPGTSTMAVTSVAAPSGGDAVYTGSFPAGANNALAGRTVFINGFYNAVNNGEFLIVFSSSTTLTVANPNAISETPVWQGNALAVAQVASTIKFRFLGVVDQSYTVNLTYQKLPTIFGPFFSSAVTAASGTEAVYTGTFDVEALQPGSYAIITGFTNANNNGTFLVVSVSPTLLIVVNPNAVAQTLQTGFVANFTWAPIPDNYSYVYDMLFLGEMLAMADDARSQIYRQRGMTSLLAKAEGLDDTQKNIYMQQWLAREAEITTKGIRTQTGNQVRLT